MNDRQALAHVFPVHGKGLGAKGHLVDKGNVIQLLFHDNAQRPLAGGHHGQGVEHTLVIAVEHEASLLWEVLLARGDNVDVSRPDAPEKNVPDKAVHLLFLVFFGVLCIAAELSPGAGNKKRIFQDHGHNTVHSVSSLYLNYPHFTIGERVLQPSGGRNKLFTEPSYFRPKGF